MRTVSDEGQEVERQIIPLLLTLLTPWGGGMCFRVSLVILPASGEKNILGQMTIREILGIDVMADLK